MVVIAAPIASLHLARDHLVIFGIGLQRAPGHADVKRETDQDGLMRLGLDILCPLASRPTQAAPSTPWLRATERRCDTS